jgi:surface polysaccharide O-acyltransferase-like enzyme
MTDKTYYHRLDAFKFIAVLMVVAIHATTYIHLSDHANFWNYGWYRHFFEIAVPFFLFASGFLLGNRGTAKLLSYAKKNFVLYLAASAVYLVFALIKILTDRIFLGTAISESLVEVFSQWTPASLFRGDMLQGHLWYLAATCWAVLLLVLIRRFTSDHRVVLGIATGLYALMLSGLLPLEVLAINGGFPKALFYITLGIAVFNSKPPRNLWILGAGLVSLTVFAAMRYSGMGPLMEIPLALATLCIGIYATDPVTRETRLSGLGKYALSIYVLHILFLRIIDCILLYAPIDAERIRWHVAYPIAITAIATLGSIALHNLFTQRLLAPTQRFVDRLFSNPRRAS